MEDDEPVDEGVQLRRRLEIRAAYVGGCAWVQTIDGGDHLHELKAQGGESLRLLGADGIGGDRHGRERQGVDPRCRGELRALAPRHRRGDASAGGEHHPEPRGAVDA